jgi:hypothetical protein
MANILTAAQVVWATGWARYLIALVLDNVTLCNTDPPAYVALTEDDMLNVAQPFRDPLGAITAANKFYNLIKRYAWYQFCECSPGPTPAAPAAPAAPANLPDPNPSVPQPAASACYTVDYPADPMNSNSAIRRRTFNQNANGTPTSVRVTTTTSVSVAPGPGITNTLEFNDRNGGLISSIALGSQTNNSTKTQVFSIPPTAYDLDVLIQANGVGGTTSQRTFIEVFCNGVQPGAPASACCPPDPTLQAALTQILGIVTLIQRQKVPFAYVPGTVHAGLTGSGVITVSGILGLLATLTLPAWIGSVGNNPPHLFQAGFLTPGNSDGYSATLKLDRNPALFLDLDGDVTRVGYNLHSGVSLDLTELLREP